MKNQPNIRQNFYQGQSVSATNLNLLQDYSDNARGQIMSDILGYGIVSGFEVTKSETDKSTLLISSGLAYTEHGVRLQSPEIQGTTQALKIKIPESELPTGEAIITKFLVISLDYIKSGDITDNSQNLVQTKWTPTVKATLYLDKDSITMNDLPIAEIILDKSGINTINQNGQTLFDFHDLTTTVTGNKEAIDKTVKENKEAIEKAVEVVDKKVDDNTSAIENTNTDVSKNTSGVASNKASITNLTSTVSDVDKKVTDLTSTVETNTSAIATTNIAVATNKSAIEAIGNIDNAAIAENTAAIDNLNSALSVGNGYLQLHEQYSCIDMGTENITMMVHGSYPPMSRGIVLAAPAGVNILDGDLHLNDIPIMETGTNNGGTYIKFSNGLLINIASITYSNMMDGDLRTTFPCAFKDTNYYIDPITHMAQNMSDNYVSKSKSGISMGLMSMPSRWGSEGTFIGLFIGYWK